MSIQFVIGRAGSGKTTFCLDAIRARLRERAGDGHHLILLVPEQAAFQMERALIEIPEIPAYARCDVLSFRRLAHRILNETGIGDHRAVGPIGRIMLIRLILTRRRRELSVLDAARGGPGLLGQLAVSVEEWLSEMLDPAELLALAESLADDNPLAAARLRDLHLIYHDYRALVEDEYLDAACELALAAEAMDRIDWLDGAELWVDGFAGFTALEQHVLVHLIQRSRATTIALLMDASSALLSDAGGPVNPFSLFARTEQTYSKLGDLLRRNNLSIVPPKRLTPATPPRFRSSDLAQLERSMFVASPRAPTAPESRPRNVRLIAAADRRVEVDAAVAELDRIIRESAGRLRYRDVAIIVRDLEPYHDLLAAALTAHGIPYFIDWRRPAWGHPLVELLRLLPRLARHDMQLDDVRLVMKTGLFALTDDEMDLLENYVIAHGIEGIDAWFAAADWTYRRLYTKRDPEAAPTPQEQFELARINELRRRFIDPLHSWISEASIDAATTASTWAFRLWRALEAMDAGATIERWAEQASDEGQTEQADVHRQVWRDLCGFLDELVETLSAETLSLNELESVLEAGLSTLTLALAPPTLDQVLIGSIERSRHPDLAAVLLLGFSDGSFPAMPREDVLLGDAERTQLAERGVQVGTTRRQSILDERLLAYIAMTRPSEMLWISYPRADESGRPMRPSPFVADVCAALPGLSLQPIDEPTQRRDVWPIGRPRELAAQLALEFRHRPADPAADDERIRQRWNALYEGARSDAVLARSVASSLGSLIYRNDSTLEAETIAHVAAAIRHFSASRIETFAMCPFRHFADYGLGLTERVEFEIDAIDFGLLHHKLLEEFFQELIDERKNLADLELDDIQQRIVRLRAKWVGSLTDEALLDDARNQFLLARSDRTLLEALQRQRILSGVGELAPRAVEWTFGLEETSGRTARHAEALVIKTPRGRDIQLVGKIDRIDLVDVGAECFGIVLDYKRSTDRRLSLWRLYEGIDVQLLTYMLALVQRGQTLAGRPITPIGAFYVSLAPYRETSADAEASTEAESIPTKRKPHGLFEAGHIAKLDTTLEPSQRSRALPVRLKNDGGIADMQRSEAYDEAQMQRLRRFAEYRIGTLADAILDGDVSVRPYRVHTTMPCSFCEFRSVCRYDHSINRPRVVEPADREVMFAKMQQAMEERSS